MEVVSELLLIFAKEISYQTSTRQRICKFKVKG